MQDLDVIILGAGFAGLCAAVELRRAGRERFVVLEKADDVGGTWRDNTYPGVECDVPSHLYSYSFAPNPYWSKPYATGAEILTYLRHCAERHGVRDKVVFGTRAVGAVWDGERWVITTAAGEDYRARFVIAGLGGLHTPNVPELPGQDAFGGAMFHTACWQHQIELARARVAMIGTGATAVQAAPEVAEVADRFYLFQRSPIWVGPKRDPLYTPEQQQQFAANPNLLRRHRWEQWRRWETSGVDAVKAGTAINRAAEEAARQNIMSTVRDPVLAAKLTPDYNITCKRPTFSNRYYPMFNRETVQLVTDPIERITRAGIVAGGHEIAVDVIILATGFKPFNITHEIEIQGLRGVRLADAWGGRVTSYRSVMARDFPNFFILLGPNSGGLTSAIQMIEAGAKFALRAIAYIESCGAIAINPTQRQVDEFTRHIDEVSATTTINQGCTSWWTENGQNHAIWPESSVTYRMMLADFRPDHFDQVNS